MWQIRKRLLLKINQEIVSDKKINIPRLNETQQSSYNILFINKLFHAFMQSSVWLVCGFFYRCFVDFYEMLN